MLRAVTSETRRQHLKEKLPQQHDLEVLPINEPSTLPMLILTPSSQYGSMPTLSKIFRFKKKKKKPVIHFPQNCTHHSAGQFILRSKDLETSSLKLCFWFLFFFFLFRATPAAYGEVPRLRVQSELQLPDHTRATATQDPSHICDLHHISRQHQILNPLSKARDQTRNLMVSSWIW